MAYNSGARRRAARKKKPVAPKKTSTKRTSTGGKMNRKKTVTSASTSVTPKRTSTGGKMNRKKTGAETGAVKTTPKKVMDRNLRKKVSKDGTTASYRNMNRRAQVSSKVTGGEKTKAGTYNVYSKNSAAAKNFRAAFANAKKAGYKTFTWEGKKYSTKTK